MYGQPFQGKCPIGYYGQNIIPKMCFFPPHPMLALMDVPTTSYEFQAMYAPPTQQMR